MSDLVGNPRRPVFLDLIHFLNRSPLYRSALYQEDFSVTLLELGLSRESIKANIEPEHCIIAHFIVHFLESDNGCLHNNADRRRDKERI